MRKQKSHFIRRRKTQDRARRQEGFKLPGRRLPLCNRAELARELFQILHFM